MELEFQRVPIKCGINLKHLKLSVMEKTEVRESFLLDRHPGASELSGFLTSFLPVS
jgi:hypothetical protein